MKRHIHHFCGFATFCCLLAGCLMPLAFAPYDFSIVAILALAVLGYFITDASPKQSFNRGFCFGVGYFGFGIYWVYIAVRYFGNAAPILSALLTLLLVLYLALFPALSAYILARLHPRARPQKLMIVYPALFALLELMRTWFMTGFPWLLVGYSQLSSPLSHFAPIVGVYGLTFLTVCCAGALAWFCYQNPFKSSSKLPLAFIATLFFSGFLLSYIHWTTPNHKALNVGMVQANIHREFKWNPQKSIDNITEHRQMTDSLWDSDFIIWPESSFSLPQTYGRRLLDVINQDAKRHNTTLALGLPYIDRDGHYLNTLLLLGKDQGKYSKRHLVPFGEFTPFESIIGPMMSWLDIPMSSFTSGANDQSLLNVQGLPVAPYICYEIVYPKLVNRDVPKAQILLTISEDAWFGDSNAVYQHLQMAQMRSKESGRYSLFSVNTGVSAIIDERGRIVQSLGLHERGVIRGKVPAMIGATPWAIIGDNFWLVIMALAMLGVLVYEFKVNVRRHPNESPSHSDCHS